MHSSSYIATTARKGFEFIATCPLGFIRRRRQTSAYIYIYQRLIDRCRCHSMYRSSIPCASRESSYNMCIWNKNSSDRLFHHDEHNSSKLIIHLLWSSCTFSYIYFSSIFCLILIFISFSLFFFFFRLRASFISFETFSTEVTKTSVMMLSFRSFVSLVETCWHVFTHIYIRI